MLPYKIYLWQHTPALRLLVPFACGILLQWYTKPPAAVVWFAAALSILILTLFAILPLHRRFKAAPLQGLALTLLIATTGMCITTWNDIRYDQQWFGKTGTANDGLIVTLQEPLVEKPNSYKALARIEKIVGNDSVLPATGKAIFYFNKEAAAGLEYGTQLWVIKKVEPVRNSGNPAGFDYQRYSLFAGITHQSYLTANDFIILPTQKKNWFDNVIVNLREQIVTILKTHVGGAKETGLAEALLIGYKDDLDKTLVQAYSNTGVVHIIAISGLHVGLIYGVLLLLTKPLRGKKLRGLRFIIILAALWSFGVLAGAQPSVLRSVVMFSFIAASVVLDRNASVYNNLALSALLLLCYNPLWLWDVGFQLSYTAVLSIVIFFKPIYNWIYLQNKALDGIWRLMAVTLAAQILTTPISLYYFHQFPVLFLFTNLVAVPLSTLILFCEMLLCILNFITPVAAALGWATTVLIRLMNGFIEQMDAVSFAVWEGIFISGLQALLLMAFIAGFSFWLLERWRAGLWCALLSLLVFTTLRTFSIIHASGQQKLIVYNIAKRQAIDVFSGRTAAFIGDAALLQNSVAAKLHLQPTRIAHRIHDITFPSTKAFQWCGKTVMIIDTAIALQSFSKLHVDVLVLSKNPKLYIKDVVAHFAVSQIVIDASVPPWIARLWQQDCNAIKLPCYDVAQKGAFVMPGPRPTFAAL
jgi:competence protein ComEC